MTRIQVYTIFVFLNKNLVESELFPKLLRTQYLATLYSLDIIIYLQQLKQSCPS